MKRVIICGLGAIGLTLATKLKSCCDLKILVDKERLEKYKLLPPVFNGVVQHFDYILPTDKCDVDLVFICTKFDGLGDVLENLKNFVVKNTIIISLINGISSEGVILDKYAHAKILKSYFIGHSAVREKNSVVQDGVGEIVIERDEEILNFFDSVGINYSVPNDINYSMWLKFTMNIFSNQTSAILRMTFGELKSNKNFINFAKKIIGEVKTIAKKVGISNLEHLEEDALKALFAMCDEGKTSMFQDVLAKKKTEVDIFAGEILKLGKKYGVQTPYNEVLYDLIKIVEEKNEHSLHTS